MTDKEQKHTEGPIHYQVNYGGFQVRETMPAGQVMRLVATVEPQGTISHAEAETNAARLVLCWNSHDELVETVETLLGTCPPTRIHGVQEVNAILRDARALLDRIGGK